MAFDIVGGAAQVALFWAVLGLMGGKQLAHRVYDPRVENYERLAAAAAGCVLSIYVINFLASTMHGYDKLFAFLLTIPLHPQPLTVWFACGGWALITATSIFSLSRAMAAPLGARAAMPYGRSLIQATICGTLWSWEAVIPIWRWADRNDWIFWFCVCFNFCLLSAYVVGMAEGLVGLAIPLMVRGGNAAKRAKALAAKRNEPMISAYDHQKKSWWKR